MEGLVKGRFPDITPVQIIGLVLAGIGPFLVLLGVNLDPDQQDALTKLVALGGLLIGGDAAIRVGRNVAIGKAADPNALPAPPAGTIDGGHDTLTDGLTEEERNEALALERDGGTPGTPGGVEGDGTVE